MEILGLISATCQAKVAKKGQKCKRKFIVVSGCMLEDILSGVPQGTMLPAILFVIIMSEIDENIKKSIVKSFVDDIKASKKINNSTDADNL